MSGRWYTPVMGIVEGVDGWSHFVFPFRAYFFHGTEKVQGELVARKYCDSLMVICFSMTRSFWMTICDEIDDSTVRF